MFILVLISFADNNSRENNNYNNMTATETRKSKDSKNSKIPTDALCSQIYHFMNPEQIRDMK
jgi:hypothetical protein